MDTNHGRLRMFRLRKFAASSAQMSIARTKTRQVVAITMIALLSLSSFAQQPSTSQLPNSPQAATAPSTAFTLVVPAGTRIALVLTDPILSRSVRRGDEINAETTSPVTVGNQVVIPPGTFVQGKLDNLARKGRRGELHLSSLSVIFPNGYVAQLSGPVDLESDDGYAIADPGEGKIVGMFAAPAAGMGLGALIGHAVAGSQSTSINTSLPPSCGVPTPGCSGGTSQSLTIPGSKLKSTAIGSMVGLAIGGVVSLVLLSRSHNFFLDQGSPVELILRQPLSLDQSHIANEIQQPGQESAAPSTKGSD